MGTNKNEVEPLGINDDRVTLSETRYDSVPVVPGVSREEPEIGLPRSGTASYDDDFSLGSPNRSKVERLRRQRQ